MRCRPCRCAWHCVVLCARPSSCVHAFCTDFVLLRAEAHRGAVVAAGALPALVSALASPTSEAMMENCAGAIRNISSGEAHRGAIVAAGALPALVSVMTAASTSEATREHCAVAMRSISMEDHGKAPTGADAAVKGVLDASGMHSTQRNSGCVSFLSRRWVPAS